MSNIPSNARINGQPIWPAVLPARSFPGPAAFRCFELSYGSYLCTRKQPKAAWFCHQARRKDPKRPRPFAAQKLLTEQCGQPHPNPPITFGRNRFMVHLPASKRRTEVGWQNDTCPSLLASARGRVFGGQNQAGPTRRKCAVRAGYCLRAPRLGKRPRRATWANAERQGRPAFRPFAQFLPHCVGSAFEVTRF